MRSPFPLLCLLAVLPLAGAERLGTIATRELIDAINGQRCLLVDCRGAEAYAKGHFPLAVDGSLADGELGLFLPLGDEVAVVVYGADGKDAAPRAVATRLAGLGAARLLHFADGHAALARLRVPLEKGPLRERPLKLPGALTFKGRTYLKQVPPIDAGTRPALLVWCHPASGTPLPEFRFWQQSGAVARNTILLCPKAFGQRWVRALDERFVHELVAQVMQEHDVDPTRVVFGGHSSGAIFTLAYALHHPEVYRHLVVACGVLPPGGAPQAGDGAPVVDLYHSRNDQVFPWAQLEATKAALEQQGYTVALTEDDQQHSIGMKLVERMQAILAGLAGGG